MGRTNFSATASLVSITSENCGTDLLERLNDTISPKSGDTTKLDDACEIIEEKTGCSNRWSME
jgi:hypothetical protein